VPTTRLISVMTAAVAALALTAGPAAAKEPAGTVTGGAAPTPPPATAPIDPWTLCPDYAASGTVMELADGSSTFANVVADGACVIVRNAGGVLTLHRLGLARGWTANVKSSGGGTESRVFVEFNSPTGAKHSARIEPGKVVIR
jgi:hypothetical protein